MGPAQRGRHTCRAQHSSDCIDFTSDSSMLMRSLAARNTPHHQWLHAGHPTRQAAESACCWLPGPYIGTSRTDIITHPAVQKISILWKYISCAKNMLIRINQTAHSAQPWSAAGSTSDRSTARDSLDCACAEEAIYYHAPQIFIDLLAAPG